MRAGLSAIFDLDRAPVQKWDLTQLADRGTMSDSRTRTIWIGDWAALAADELPLRTRFARARKSLASRDSLHAAWNGTLDNSVELTSSLGFLRKPQEIADSDLVLAAYRAWGIACVEKLIGEFSFVLYDGRRKRLLIARDSLGVNEIFFRLENRRLLVASTLFQLRDPATDALSDLDQEYLADFLASQVSVGARTALRQVKRLCAGHFLIADSRGIQTRRYWRPIVEPELELENVEDYSERFSELFGDSLEVCLGTAGKVWAELSGGLDSSSLTAMACKKLNDEPPRRHEFASLTIIFPDTPASDEQRWVDKFQSELQVENHRLVGDDAFFDGAIEAAGYRNDPHFGILCFPLHRKEAEFLVANDVDALLSGARAEAVILDKMPPVQLADYFRTFRLLSLGRQLRSWRAEAGESLLNLIVWNCLRPILFPRSVEVAADRRLRVEAWIDRSYASRWNLAARARLRRAPREHKSFAGQYQAEMLARSEQMIHRGLLEWKVETRYPFLFRPLVEFCLSVPWAVKHQPGQHKSLLRAGMKGVLPEPIRTRKSWSSPTAAALKALSRRWVNIRALEDNSLLVDLGILDKKKWREALTLARHGYSQNFVALTSSIALEYWLRALSGAYDP